MILMYNELIIINNHEIYLSKILLMESKMLFVEELSQAEEVMLESMYNNHPLAMTRKRGHSILLSNKGYSIPQIAEITSVCRQSLSLWIKMWDEMGLLGLLEKPRSGRPRALSIEEENEAVEKVKKEPRNLKKVLAEIADKTGLTICKETLRRICKRAGLKWKRVRKSLKSKRDEKAYQEAFKQIAELLEKEKNGEANVCFFDESGFDLQPSIPSAWQDEIREIPSSRSKRLSVLGFINKSSQLESFVFEGNINTEVVVACFDKFSQQINKPTYVWIDNASIHTSDLFLENLSQWEEKGLYIRNISPYSPELNIIEILWKKIKYEWMPFEAYESFKSLKENLFDILKKVGDEYVIAFS
jgi:transposase